MIPDLSSIGETIMKGFSVKLLIMNMRISFKIVAKPKDFQAISLSINIRT